jgi:hypothetical protein
MSVNRMAASCLLMAQSTDGVALNYCKYLVIGHLSYFNTACAWVALKRINKVSIAIQYSHLALTFQLTYTSKVQAYSY